MTLLLLDTHLLLWAAGQPEKLSTEALEPEKVKVVIEEVRSDDEPHLPAVSLLLVPDAPQVSRALVRPWLL